MYVNKATGGCLRETRRLSSGARVHAGFNSSNQTVKNH